MAFQGASGKRGRALLELPVEDDATHYNEPHKYGRVRKHVQGLEKTYSPQTKATTWELEAETGRRKKCRGYTRLGARACATGAAAVQVLDALGQLLDLGVDKQALIDANGLIELLLSSSSQAETRSRQADARNLIHQGLTEGVDGLHDKHAVKVLFHAYAKDSIAAQKFFGLTLDSLQQCIQEPEHQPDAAHCEVAAVADDGKEEPFTFKGWEDALKELEQKATLRTAGAARDAPVEQQTVIYNGLESSTKMGMFASVRATHGGAVNPGVMKPGAGDVHQGGDLSGSELPVTKCARLSTQSGITTPELSLQRCSPRPQQPAAITRQPPNASAVPRPTIRSPKYQHMWSDLQ